MSPRARIASIAAVAVIAVVVALVASRSKNSAPVASGPQSLPGCTTAPPAVATPKWYPKDLPLPPGSYASQDLPAPKGIHRGLFVIKADLRGFVIHALSVWKEQGWNLGRGDAEPGEAEDSFAKPGNRYGAFRARANVYCDPNVSQALIVVNDPKVRTAPVPTFTPTNTASAKPIHT